MPLVTSAGIGSGLDLESIIQATVNAEDTPKLQRFDKAKSKLNVELSSLGAVKSSLSALNDIVKKLADIDSFNKRTSTVTQPASGNLISVSSNKNSTPGNFNIEVMQLAHGSRATTSGAYTDSSDVVTTTAGKLTLTAGTKTFDVDIAANATLEEIRTAINESADNFGISVNIINTGGATPEAKLVITSSVSGAGNDLSITNDNAELDNISTTAFAGGAGGLSIAATDQAQDAIIEVDGIAVNSSSNIFTNAVQDLTITALKQSESSEKAKLTVDYDKAGVEKLIDEFVTAYNNVVGTIDYHTKVGAGLYGDASMRSLTSQMNNTLSSVITGAGGFESLFDIGIGLKRDGTLEKKSLVRSVSESLASNFADVGKVFSGENGIGSKFKEMLSSQLEAKGSFKFRQDAINVSLKQLETDRESHNYRMDQLEAGLRAKYAGLDALIAQMQSTSSYVTQQLANLPGFTKSK